MKKILVIDDQPDVLEMIEYVLSTEGYSVVNAQGGEEGLERARAFRPNLILCDIMMPGMSGYDVLEVVRHDPELSATPFVFLTAKAAPEALREGMKLGADDYLTKPFSADELVDAIRARLEKYDSIKSRFERQLELLRQGLSTILPHELRTPLTLILAHSSLLLESYDAFDRESVLESIAAIQGAGKRLHRLLENLLVYVELKGDATLRLEHPYIENAGLIIEESVSRSAATVGRSEDIFLRVDYLPAPVHGFHLKKVIEEIIDNALKFSPAGTPIKVKAEFLDGELRIQVTDQGRGISRDELERVDAYVQFGRNHFEQQGGGMGLAVVKRIVELYGGKVAFESQPGFGTTIQISIPTE